MRTHMVIETVINHDYYTPRLSHLFRDPRLVAILWFSLVFEKQNSLLHISDKT